MSADPFQHANLARVRKGIWLGGRDGRLECPGCGRSFGSAASKVMPVSGGEADWTETRDAIVGARIDLDPGYVNATTRHPSGARWYRPGKHAESPSPVVKLPAVVTCRCGRDIGLKLPDEVARMARATKRTRNERLTDLLVTEAGERWAEHQAEVDRGK